MNIVDVNNNLENIPLPQEQKRATLQLIDIKINNDMKEVIAQLKHMEDKFESRFQLTNEKIQMVHDKLSNEIKVIYWVIGISNALLLFMIARK